ncbi:MRPS22 [Cordylochernes scorpioides]|uniref:MRPS22 n=1 Tax=Cordylochernes scorpioides TaxID=51811 RepID=A0ABY6K406_9ARAC|nr:MRPS22 [Cordylochernes scorpioides]
MEYKLCSPVSLDQEPLQGDAACRPDPEADIESLFLDYRVQRLLRDMTGLDLEKVFTPQKEIPQPLPVMNDFYKEYLLKSNSIKPPQYTFMTKEEYEKTYKKYKHRALKFKLQMPPVMKSRKPVDRFIRKDPELQDYSGSNYVFTDITYGIRETDKTIMVREPDGTLRTANWDERDRMNRIYNPIPSRGVTMPRMFYPENLEPILDRGDYIFVLSRNCVQFNPDDPHFIRTYKKYKHRALKFKLQMPPVMKSRKPVDRFIRKDPELQDYSGSNYVFTDITYGIRETPILDRGDYIFVLSRNCVQFNPDDPHFIRVAKRTYDHIDYNRNYDILRSTRFFGPMAFYLTTESTMDGLLVDMLNREFINDAKRLVSLYHITKGTVDSLEDSSSLHLIKDYVTHHSTRKDEVDLAVRKYEEICRIRNTQEASVSQ